MKRNKVILDEFSRRGLVPHRARFSDSETIRSRLTRVLAKEEDWLDWIPYVLPAPKGKVDVVVSPGQYLEMVSKRRSGQEMEASSSRGVDGEGFVPNDMPRLIVDGDVTIHSGGMTKLPRAVIKGSLHLSECLALAEINLTVIGGVTIKACPNLKVFSGEYFSNVNIGNAGMGALGADLTVHLNLFISECGNLKMVNCECGGRFVAKKCPELIQSGVAFFSRKEALFDACDALQKLRGHVGGVCLGNAKREVDMTGLSVGKGEMDHPREGVGIVGDAVGKLLRRPSCQKMVTNDGSISSPHTTPQNFSRR